MDIAILGTGIVGRTLASRLTELGHGVTVGTRNPAATMVSAAGSGGEPFAVWAAGNPGVHLATFGEAASDAELVVNAASADKSLDILALAGQDGIAGKVLLDLANPLDFSNGTPPSLFIKDTDSLGEQIQRAFPSARVVKSLNTLNADLMAHPEQLAEPGTVFVAGNDASAKETVAALLAELGHRDIIDLGDITASRGTEMLLPLWMRLWNTLGTTAFNFKVIR